MSWLFVSGGQSIGVLASGSVFPMNIQGWFPLGLTDLIFLLSKEFSRVFSSTTVWKYYSFAPSLLCDPALTSIHDYWGNYSFDYGDLCQQTTSLLFKMLSRFVIAFLTRSKHFLILWLQSLSSVILQPKKIKSVIVSTFSPSVYHEVMGLNVMIIIFCMLSFKPAWLSAIRVVSSAYLRLLIFLLTVLITACDSSSPVVSMMYST